MVIERDDRIAHVLAQDEKMLDTLVSISPHFGKLRNPVMRRTMGRLATIGQAARIAGLDPDVLVRKLNHALQHGHVEQSGPAAASPFSYREDMHADADADLTAEEMPRVLANIPAEKIVDLDVREALRNGEEPFSQIMAARRNVPPGGALCLRAIFEPAPLYVVMAKQGFAHWTRRLADDDWKVWFYSKDLEEDGDQPESPDQAEAVGHATAGLATSELDEESDDDVTIIDVRGLEPPEPMVRTLAALEQLPRDGTLLQINQRVPQFLLPKLDELGFRYEIREQNEDLVRIFIRHGAGR